jgi:Icc-related predicted phosphoesterase
VTRRRVTRVLCAADAVALVGDLREPGTQILGRSLVVSPGSLAEGCYAIADLHSREAQLEQFAAATA